jgi:hypothetical protein
VEYSETILLPLPASPNLPAGRQVLGEEIKEEEKTNSSFSPYI